MGEVVDFIVISGREAGATIWRKSKKGFQFFQVKKSFEESIFSLNRKNHAGEVNFFQVKKSFEESIFSGGKDRAVASNFFR